MQLSNLLFSICLFLLLPINCLAADIDQLILAGNWDEASRATFNKALQVNPNESKIVRDLAKAGFLQDAITAAQRMHPNLGSAMLIEIARDDVGLKNEQRRELLQKASVSARDARTIRSIRSAYLCEIALIFTNWGMAQDAKILFDESIANAEAEKAEGKSEAYRKITEVLTRADVKDVQFWMLDIIEEKVANAKDAFNLAFTYRELARLRNRTKNSASALNLVKKGFVASNKIDTQFQKTAVIALAEQAIEIGDIALAESEMRKRYGNIDGLQKALALNAAKQNDYSNAIQFTDSLTSNFYVDRKSDTINELALQAIHDGNLKSAHFFASRLNDVSPSQFVNVLKLIAELEVKRGDKKAALKTYTQAMRFVNVDKHHTYGQNVVISVELGNSLLKSGFKKDSLKIVKLAEQQISNIPVQRHRDRIEALTAVAMAFRMQGMKSIASKHILEAYQSCLSFLAMKDSSRDLHISRTLSMIALELANMRSK